MDRERELVRGIGLLNATTLNMIDMIGVGPFITIPLIVGAMGGPQAMLGWILGAVFALCDGLVWAELGAAMPGSGGSYRYLQQIYGPGKLGQLISFLFIWQLSFSAPLSIASGSLGLANYATYIWPGLERTFAARDLRLQIPLLGMLEARVAVTAASLVAVALLAVTVVLLYRRITAIAKIANFLWIGVMGTVAWVILAGLTHFSAARAFSFPPNAFRLSNEFFLGMGSAMLIAAYDYWGYYNVCFLGGEIKDPGKTIPRALILSIMAVACIYIVMNISILGVIPWQDLNAAATAETQRLYVVSTLMSRVYGRTAADIATALIMWTAFASVFSLLLGYSRVPFAAAQDGNYFRAFASVHPRFHIPHVSLLALGIVAGLACFLRLQDVISALVVIRITLQFLFQSVGVMILRIRRPDLPRPFRMWLYPLPALLATVGFLFVLRDRAKELRYAAVILVIGIIIYLVRAARRREWPFVHATS
jgi:amino acid transporter